MVGDNVRKYPELYKRILAEGHQVGNHTHNHIQGLTHSIKEYSYNVEKANAYIQSHYVRPPHGICLAQSEVQDCDVGPRYARLFQMVVG